ncbi:broad-complex core protein isoforms 1/2/3/4/5-like isoform X4 [Planococcus citri]|uniref:broad-complex core protein isoforms 1/2/3/4/5-like isoform X4 n=1 Tax=Planococcus citri TaxID=170843 RepID=UPI0031F7E75D
MLERVRPTTMGDLQHFCLRWNNYQNSITTAFENLRDDEDFIDVTLACDGKTLKAHRVVLSACSPYFRELLKSTPCKHPVIVLQDVVFDDLHALVEFIYHGEVNVHQRNLTSFLKTAEVLKVSGLTQQNAAASATTPASSASPSSDHYNENLSARFSTRSPGTPLDKMNPFQQPFLYSTNHSQISLANDDRNSPRTSLSQPQTNRHRRHIRSPTPIRCSQSRDDSPISLKRAKSADNALQSPLLHCSNISSLSPSTISNDDSTSRTCKNSSEALSSSRRGSPNEIANLNINNSSNTAGNISNSNNTTTSTASTASGITATTTTTTNTTAATATSLSSPSSSLSLSSPCSASATATTCTTVPITTVTTGNANAAVNYDENHNDEDVAAITNISQHNDNNNNNSNGEEDIDEDDEDEPPVDFSTTSTGVGGSAIKKYRHQQSYYKAASKSCASPKNLSLKCEPMDLVSSNNSNTAVATDDNDNDNNNFNDDDSNQSEDRLSDQSPPPNAPYPQTLLDAEDAFQGHRGYLDSKLFAAAGASFSFNMAAAALAADSLAGFNHHQSHTAVTANAVLDGLAASSQGLQVCRSGFMSAQPHIMTECLQQLPQPSSPPVISLPPPLIGNISEPQDCPHCHRRFSCYYSLKRHFQDKHEHRNTLYICEFCQRRYRTKNSLTTHKSLQHRGSSGMLKRLIRSTTTTAAAATAAATFIPRFRSTSLLFESVMYKNTSNSV